MKFLVTGYKGQLGYDIVRELKKRGYNDIIAIDKEELDLIWDKYYKNEKNHTRNKVGTGLGLSIVKNISYLNSYIVLLQQYLIL